MAYSNTGEGLHRFVDPADGAVYLYAQTFLDDAQRMFACFDQPDLKAPVTLTGHRAGRLGGAGNGAGHAGRARAVGVRRRPQPLATYLVSLIAGPYHVRRDEPRRHPARRSTAGAALAEHLDKDVDEIFEVTAAVLRPLPRAVRGAVPVRQVRPGVRARSSTPARWRTPAWSPSGTSTCSGPR